MCSNIFHEKLYQQKVYTYPLVAHRHHPKGRGIDVTRRAASIPQTFSKNLCGSSQKNQQLAGDQNRKGPPLRVSKKSCAHLKCQIIQKNISFDLFCTKRAVTNDHDRHYGRMGGLSDPAAGAASKASTASTASTASAARAQRFLLWVLALSPVSLCDSQDSRRVG